jgi:predicted amidohydrolase YtcJ
VILISLVPGLVAGQTEAELIVTNATVRTMDQELPLADSIAISGGRIVAVGKSKDIRLLSGPNTRIIEARGQLVLPGFNDAHVHFTGVGNFFSHLNSRDISNSEELSEKIARFARFLPKGRFIIGGSLDLSRWKGPAISQKELDAVSPEHPLIIYFADPKSALVNTAALKKAGLQPDETPVVTGSRLALIQNVIPRDHGSNWAEITEAASNYAASLGVTSVQDVHSDNLLSTYQTMAKAGRLKVRIYECVGMSDWKRNPSIAPKAASGDAMVRGGCIKGMADGSEDELGELAADITRADRAGHQVTIHAIGRRANANTVNAFAAAIAQNAPRDRRFRIEHAHNIANSEIARLRSLGIIPSMQPALFYDGANTGDDYPLLLRSRVDVAFGSDASMIDIDPLAGIHAAVNSGENSISVAQAVRAYTVGSAFAEFQEREKGTIAVGKLADIIVLSRDIFRIPRAEIGKTVVEMTILGGKIVHSSRTGNPPRQP